jgi:hypothetical protein
MSSNGKARQASGRENKNTAASGGLASIALTKAALSSHIRHTLIMINKGWTEIRVPIPRPIASRELASSVTSHLPTSDE